MHWTYPCRLVNLLQAHDIAGGDCWQLEPCFAGAKAFLGQMPGTKGAPLLPLAYIAINLAMNVAVLNLLRTSGALVTTLSLSALIPLTIVAFTFQWPLIGAAASLSWNFVIGTLLLMSGLVAYNWESLRKNKSE